VDLKLDYPIQLDTKEIFVSSVDTGVPHAVLFTDHVDMAPVIDLGRMIRFHKSFSPKGTNVDFVQVVDKDNARIRTYERGVEGETFACGTGAVAAGVILREKGLTGEAVNIWTKGGEVVRVYVNEDVYLEGSARVIYAGTLWPEALE
jgi:diaminopimelate epimerase